MASAAAPAPGRWLYGPLPDLLLGCGLWYAAAFLMLASAGETIRTGGAAVLAPFLVLAFGTPHYGATLVRVYRRREDRRAYSLFALHATALIVASFVFGVYDVLVGSWIVTIYLTWSPWHYTGQNYGIGVMFLRRRGVTVTPRLKRFVYAAFLLSYVLVFLALHSGTEASDYSPVVAYDPATYHFQSLGLPPALADPLFALVGIAYVVALGGSLLLLLRHGSLRAAAPTLALMAIQGLWFTIPLVLRRWNLTPGIEPWNDRYGSYYFTWIAVGHSVQYLWVTSYYAKASPAWRGQLRYGMQVMFAGALAWTLPALLFAPGVLGRLPFDAGLGLLIASAVNIHHFVLDGAIWKLRDGRIARILVRSRAEATGAEPASPGQRRLGTLVYALGAACFAVMFAAKFERESLRRSFRTGDLERVETSLARLSHVGRESPGARLLQGDALRRQGRGAEAAAAYRRSIALHPSRRAWVSLANLLADNREWQAAAEAYEAALALDPAGSDMLYHGLGLARLRLDQPYRARQAFARAAELNPERPIHRVMVEQADARIREREGSGGAPPTS